VVIFLPSIIDGKKATYQDEFVATPINPPLQEHTKSIAADTVNDVVVDQIALFADTDIAPQVDPVPEEPVVENNEWVVNEVAEPVTIESTPVAAKTPTKTANKEVVSVTPVVDKVTIPESAWTIQLGAFQNAKNINILLKKLNKAGYQAHTIPTEVIDGELTRVFVGPDVSKEKLEKLLPQLKRLTKLQGKLLPFNAVNP
jgi:DedD protein